VVAIESIVDATKPDIIINCSGLANVDNCEKRPEAAVILNSILAADLAKLTNKRNIRFVHISTDHFESDDLTPRTETDKMWPINQYGYSKLLAEDFVKEFNPDAIVIRTNFFGWGGPSKSLVAWLADSFETRPEVIGFTDVTFSPVSTEFLAKAIVALCSSEFRGLINVSSTEAITKFDFAKIVANSLGKSNTSIKAGSIAESNLLTKRPNFLALNNSAFSELNVTSIPTIGQMVDNICRDNQARLRLNGHEKEI
jgi:dTDP-4-dehydrorhamnose reductase